MDMLRARYDVTIVGGGPVGCAAAAAFARQGASVLLVEASPNASRRFAGEWIHPTGFAVLRRFGLLGGDAEGLYQIGRGFAVFPEDQSAPIKLDYVGGGHAISCEHHVFVQALRKRVAAYDAVDYLENARARPIDEGRVQLTFSDRTTKELGSDLIVGADGRESEVRRFLWSDEQKTSPISRMLAAEFDEIEAPFEGYGHVFLGGPGPVLAYRIAENRIRLCIDLPAVYGNRQPPDVLWEKYAPALPESYRAPLRKALFHGQTRWAVNRFRPRAKYFGANVALIGDAVGCIHPLTATGITLGLLDAEALATSESLAQYARSREEASYVPELLAGALYELFTRDDRGAEPIRRAIYRTWRQEPRVRHLTMQLLDGEVTDRSQFARVFTRIGLRAAKDVQREQTQRLGAVARWSEWPIAALVPRRLRPAFRVSSRHGRPIVTADGEETKPAVASQPKNGSADSSWRFCEESLRAVSRTFSRPIELLQGDLKRAVACGYLLCRAVDTIEDNAELAQVERDRRYDSFLGVLLGSEHAEEFEALWKGVDGSTDAEVELCTNLHKVMSVFDALPLQMQTSIRRWVEEMTHGMRLYSHRSTASNGVHALTTYRDLERYCYFVAGTVGHMLTDLFLLDLKLKQDDRVGVALRSHAESFGIGLQLVNILKDVTDDHERGWSFIPRAMCLQHGIPPESITEPRHRELAHRVVAPIFAQAKSHLDEALDYTLSLPPEASPHRLFCLLPLWMAARTLVEAEGNDAMFVEGSDVKISRSEVEQLISNCIDGHQNDALLRETYAALWQTATTTNLTAERQGGL